MSIDWGLDKVKNEANHVENEANGGGMQSGVNQMPLDRAGLPPVPASSATCGGTSPRREEEYRLETDEFFFLLATGSQFLQIMLVEEMRAPAGARREQEQRREPETRGANSRQADRKSDLYNMPCHTVPIMTSRWEPGAVHRKPKALLWKPEALPLAGPRQPGASNRS